MSNSRLVLGLGFLGVVTVVAYALVMRASGPTQPIPAALADLWIASLQSPPPDPTNRWADNEAAANLGHKLFFDARLSVEGRVSCATCHDPGKEFQDGVPLGRGVGVTERRTMPIASTAHSPFLFWDGRKDSQWSQALGPLESAVEHGGSRSQYAHTIAANYRGEYERVFGPLPDLSRLPGRAGPVADPTTRRAWESLAPADRDAATQVFVNLGKAIAAYERRIQYGASRFDMFIAAWWQNGVPPEGILSGDERAGMMLFIGKGHCTQCHNGPLFTNNEFHNTGVPARMGLPNDSGRLVAVASVLGDEFNCRSRWSDAKVDTCAELSFLPPASKEMERAYKVPSLRNVGQRAPYMHAGQLPTLAHVLEHYNNAPPAPLGRSEIKPLDLSPIELRQLEAFLKSLNGRTSAPSRYLAPPRNGMRTAAAR